MKALLILALVFPITGSRAITGSPDAARSRCHHGCGSKYCKKSNCGQTCKASPCRGCWKKA